MSDLMRRIARLEDRGDDAGPCLAEVLMSIPSMDGTVSDPCEITPEMRVMTLQDIILSIPRDEG